MTNGRSQKMKMPEMMFDNASRAANPIVRPSTPTLVTSDAVLTPNAPSAAISPITSTK